jgi:membrane protease YdiL (CAAX protease family)
MADAKETAGLQPPGAVREPVRPRLVSLALAFYCALFTAAAAWRLLLDGEWPWRAQPGPPAWPLAARVAAGLAYGLGLIAASRIWTARSDAGRRLAQELSAIVGNLTTAQEAFFRGALQPRVGWLAASLLFGLAHLHPRRELRVWSLSAALAGLGFGALFSASGDLLAPVLAHGLLNAVNLRWLAQTNVDRAT